MKSYIKLNKWLFFHELNTKRRHYICQHLLTYLVICQPTLLDHVTENHVTRQASWYVINWMNYCQEITSIILCSQSSLLSSTMGGLHVRALTPIAFNAQMYELSPVWEAFQQRANASCLQVIFWFLPDSLPPQNDPASSKIGRTEDHPSVPSPPSTTLSHTPAYAQTASHPHSAFTPLAHPNRHPAFLSGKPETKSSNTKDTSSESNTNSIPKAKIWSLAEVASSKEESKSADSAKSDAPAYVTRGPMQEPFLDSAAKPPHPGFSAFRPMIGAPRPAMAGAAPGGLPAPWGHFAPSHPHPAYSYALSQHYWAMSMARSNGLSPEVAYSLSSRLSAPVPSEMKHQEIDSSKTGMSCFSIP